MSSFHRFRVLYAVAALAAALLLVFAPVLTRVQARRLSASYTRGSLSLSIPYRSQHAGAGRLTVELLDPEDHVLGRTESNVDIANGEGAWQESITPDKAIPFDEILWQRIHYRFVYGPDSPIEQPAIDGIESVSEILRRPVVRVLGQSEYLAGSRASIRVIVTDASENGTPSVPLAGSVHIELLIPDRPSQSLFTGKLNRRGSLEAAVQFPAGLTGTYDLRFVADTPIGSTEFKQSITLKDTASILLTTEKPLYQPGQTLHIRALSLDRADNKASANRPLTFELEDSKGNKVFKKSTSTDAYGIASTEFSLADEVNLGTYHLRALMGDPANPSNTAEIAINVERYVLPKFKVAIEFPMKDNKPKRDYRPGDHVAGTIRANYFFGKPVDNAEVTLKLSGADVAVFEAASATGKTDVDGAYKFDLSLPKYFAGRPLSQGSAQALVEATVKDSAAHAETRQEPITISASPLLVTAIPESGVLIPNLDNQVFVLSSYPDGSPAPATIRVRYAGSQPGSLEPQDTRDQHVTTDASGVAVIKIHPGISSAGFDKESIQVDADDHHGNRLSTSIPLESKVGTDQILLRTSQAVVKAGDPIELKVLSTRNRATAYIDIVKNGQTILTRDLDLANGQAELTLPATPEMAGTLDLNAYLFGRDAEPVADHRLIFVQPADELHIETVADQAQYKPGSEARIRFHVTNTRGEGVSAALGLQVVDEAVFALAEKQPGFAKVFFYLEQEVMKPRYEIHSLSMNDVVDNPHPIPMPHPRRDPFTPVLQEAQDHDLAARALFSATEIANPTRLNIEFGRELPQDKYEEYQQRYRQAFLVRTQKLADQLTRNSEEHPNFVGEFDRMAKQSSPFVTDAWGTTVRLKALADRQNRERYFSVQSAGPDRQFGTADDLIVYLDEHIGVQATAPDNHARGGNLEIHFEHDRGPMDQRAEITGSVVDVTGAIIPGASVTLTASSTGQARVTRTDTLGQFTLSTLAAGKYRIDITTPGFMQLSSTVTVQPRDRAILAATLEVGSATETVTVSAEAPMQLRPFAGMVFKARGAIEGPIVMAAPMRQAQAMAVLNSAVVNDLRSTGRNDMALDKKAPDAATHVRSWFPEALYINPEILTDGHGDASITIPIADSITTWRMAMLASTQSGSLGTGTSSLKVFQDFFVDLDLPVTLTQGDQVSIPVGLYNYSGKSGAVSLKLQQDDWFSLENDAAEKSVNVESNRVGSAQFTINAKRIGKFKLTLTAQLGDGEHCDVIVREIEVVPNGREQNLVFNGRLDSSDKTASTIHQQLQFPPNAIPEATTLFVRLYPGPLSQVIEGMDSILQMPSGCFEQTSSSTYPNVLALDYMKQTKKLTPEVHAKAEGYIANGYQRLLTFEVPGGGFSWFGQAPANKILTAYGLMEFKDMAKVSEVDPRLIERTANWLAAQQQPDGSWKPDTYFINEGATNRYNSDVLRITAYLAWSLADIGYQGPAVEKAKSYIESHSNSGKADAYTLALIANFAVDLSKNGDFTRRATQALLDAKSEKDNQIFWTTEETSVYARGPSAAVETTGLAVQALLKWGQASETTRKALTFLASKKDAAGNWGTTQATIMALRAILLASQVSASDVRGTAVVSLNGKPVETLHLTPENNDLFHQFAFKNIDAAQPNTVDLSFEGSGGLAYQIVGRHFTPWEQDHPAADALSIDLAYDRTRLEQNDIATATATVRNNLGKTANMIMVDLGIPPGFELLSEDLQTIQEKSNPGQPGHLEKFSQTATQAILYFNALTPHQTITLKYRLRAKYPIRARTFESKVYEYYDPQINALAHPVQMLVAERADRAQGKGKAR